MKSKELLTLGDEPIYTLTGGPNPVPDRVLHAISKQTLYHYDPLFLEIYEDTTEKCKRIFQTQNDIIIMHGEAVLGLEAAAASLIEPGDKCLNLASGPFGKGYSRHLKRYGGKVTEIEVPFNGSVDPAAVRNAFENDSDIRIVSFVHSETPAGTLNPAKEICEIAGEYGALTIVDAVSSVGGIDVRTDDWGIDVCVAAPQKCISGTPGSSIISVSKNAWDKMLGRTNPLRGSILSMLDMKERWIEDGRFPYTPSVNQVYSINEAVTLILEEGLANVIARHKKAAKACKAGVAAMGLELWPVSEEICSECVTAVKVPEGLTDEVIRNKLRSDYSIMISGSHGELVGHLFRIGHMGNTARLQCVIAALDMLEFALSDLECEINKNAAAEAAKRAYFE